MNNEQTARRPQVSFILHLLCGTALIFPLAGCGNRPVPAPVASAARVEEIKPSVKTEEPEPAHSAEQARLKLAQLGYKYQLSDLALALEQNDKVAIRLFKGAEMDIDEALFVAPKMEAGSVIVQRAIENGANANRKTSDGITALHIASQLGRDEIADILLRKGAEATPEDFSFKDRNGDTALHRSVTQNKKERVQLLLAKGADIEAKNNEGSTPLHSAAQVGSAEIVELLLARGADVNAKDNEGGTPLHTAVLRGSTDLVELLLAKGADVNLKDRAGWAPMRRAMLRGNKDMADLLRKHGAKG